MNRRSFLLGTTITALGFFAGGAWYVRDRRSRDEAAATARVLAQSPEALIRPYSPILGPADAPVTLVEFFDPSCEACRAFHPVVGKLLEEYPTQLRLVLRYTPFHQGSEEAVRILEAARMQDKFTQVLDALFEYQPAWAADSAPRPEVAWQVAAQAGIDMAQAESQRLNPATTAVLNQDKADLATMQIKGTPTFFLQGERLESVSFASLEAAVKAAVAKV